MLRSYRGVRPRVASNAYVDVSAQVVGDVHYIRIGAETVGHGVTLHGCVVVTERTVGLPTASSWAFLRASSASSARWCWPAANYVEYKNQYLKEPA